MSFIKPRSLIFQLIWGAALVGAGAVGFGVVWFFLSEHSPPAHRVFSSYVIAAKNGWVPGLTSGWTVAGDGTFLMSGRKALIDARIYGIATGDIRLSVSGTFMGREPSRKIRIKINDRDIGLIQPTGTDGNVGSEFQVPRTAFNAMRPLSISFEGEAESGGFALSSLKLGDEKSGVFNYQGFVDGCSRTELSGWARDGDSPTPVTITVAGRMVASITPNFQRPDLEAAGLPRDAGFRYVPSSPFTAGDEISVAFGNGVQLRKSPCAVP